MSDKKEINIVNNTARALLVTPDNYYGVEEWYMHVISCPKCSHKLPARGANYCSRCGVSIKLSTTVNNLINT